MNWMGRRERRPITYQEGKGGNTKNGNQKAPVTLAKEIDPLEIVDVWVSPEAAAMKSARGKAGLG